MQKTRRVFMISTAVLPLLILVLLVFANIFILGSFERLEREQGQRNVERVRDFVQNEISGLERAATDWAEWDEPYRFLSNANGDFVQRNITSQTFQYLDLSVLVYMTHRGRILFAGGADKGKLVPAPAGLLEKLPVINETLMARKSATGILILPEGPLLISSRPVLDSHGQGPSRGILLMGRRLDNREIGKIARVSHLSVSFHPVSGGYRDIAGVLQGPDGSPATLVGVTDKTTAVGYGLLRDIFGKPALIVQVDFPRKIYAMGKESVLYFLLCLSAFAVLALLGGLFLFGKISSFQKERRHSETRYNAVIRQTSEGILLVETVSGRILETNHTLAGMLGYTVDELLSRTASDIFGGYPLGISHESGQSDDHGAFPSGETNILCRDGRSLAVELRAVTIAIGTVEALCVTVHDITDRKRSENRLAKLNDCFLSFTTDPAENIGRLTAMCGELMEADCALYNRLDRGMLCTRAHWRAPSDLALIDRPEGHICNDVINKGDGHITVIRDLQSSVYADTDPNVRAFGLQTYIGAPVRCGLQSVGSLCVVYGRPIDPDEHDLKLMEILAVAVGVEEERLIADEALRTANNELEARVRDRTAALTEANELLRRDIEERRKVEQALRKEKSIREMVFEATPDMITVIDRDFRIIHSNWGAGYDYVPQEVRASTPHCYDAFYPGQGHRCDPCHAAQVFAGGKPVVTEKLNPKIGYVEIRTCPIFDDSGQVSLVTEHIRDITERKRLEEEILKSQKLESLGVLAGGIAHDFNNLLTTIMGNISLARAHAEPSGRISTRLEEAEKACRRAGDLTSQLLTFSRGGAPVKKSASIEQLVRDSVSFALRGSNVSCRFAIPRDIWHVEVDPGQMSQVINNLIINADQAMPDGGVISVFAENVLISGDSLPPLANGRYVKIRVEDSGTGIHESYLDKIFDPYFTTKAKGSGLGLATVYSIMKKHDGLVTVDTRMGIGTAFNLYLPAADSAPASASEPHPSLSFGKGKILVMDDEESVRDVAGGILSHLGYKADFCRDGQEAIHLYTRSLASSDPYSAVLMDLTIPGGMGGREALQKLQEIDPDVKGIVTSGYSNDPILANYGRYGFRGVVTKPYDVGELAAALAQIVGPPA